MSDDMESMATCVFLSCPVAIFDEKGVVVPVMQDAVREAPALGVYSLIAHLNSSGIKCECVDWIANPHLTIVDVVNILSDYEIIFYSANSMNWGLVLDVACKVKSLNPYSKGVVGGPHPTHYPSSVINKSVFTAIFRGEADNSIVDIYHALKYPDDDNVNINGFCYCDFACRNSFLPNINTIHNLDDLPSIEPKFSILEDDCFKSIPVETSRGCKFNCAFCSIPSPNNWRGWSVERSIEKLEHAYKHIQRSSQQVVSIIDDAFTIDNKRSIKIGRELYDDDRWKNRISYDVTLVDLRNEELIETLKPITYGLLVGAEVATKNDAKLIKKAATPSLIRLAAANLMKYGLSERAVFSFIIGLPWHKEKDCIKVAEFVNELSLEYGVRAYIQWYWPMPGSEIWNTLVTNEKVKLELLEVPGYFLTEEWFYSVRNMADSEIRNVCEKINLMKILINTHRTIRTNISVPAIEFAMPHLKMLQ